MATFLRVMIGSLAIFFIGAVQHGAKQSSTNETKGPCDWAMTQSDMNQCFGEQYKKSDAHLNAVYKKVIALLENDLKAAVADGNNDQKKYAEAAIQKLKTTEKAWIQYRDLDCDAAEFEIQGGSMSPMVGAICMTTVIEHRISDMKDAYGSPERIIE
jgi:uncharacterized protein YecT (DUF1311 family)